MKIFKGILLYVLFWIINFIAASAFSEGSLIGFILFTTLSLLPLYFLLRVICDLLPENYFKERYKLYAIVSITFFVLTLLVLQGIEGYVVPFSERIYIATFNSLLGTLVIGNGLYYQLKLKSNVIFAYLRSLKYFFVFLALVFPFSLYLHMFSG